MLHNKYIPIYVYVYRTLSYARVVYTNCCLRRYKHSAQLAYLHTINTYKL